MNQKRIATIASLLATYNVSALACEVSAESKQATDVLNQGDIARSFDEIGAITFLLINTERVPGKSSRTSVNEK